MWCESRLRDSTDVVGQLGHAHAVALGLGQRDEDAVVVVVEAVGLEVLVERLHQAARAGDEAAPRVLLVVGQPGGGGGSGA